MGIPLFERFSEMVERLPVKAVVPAAGLQRQMLVDDLICMRATPINEASSIIAFCNFLENATDARRAPHMAVPIQHFGFYRATVKRLVRAGVLSNDAGARFDTTFSAAGFGSLKAA